jgi:hypothetical protein
MYGKNFEWCKYYAPVATVLTLPTYRDRRNVYSKGAAWA